MIFVDTGYLVALLSERDELHARATAWSSRAIGPFVSTEYVLLEVLNTFAAPSDRAAAHGLVRRFRERDDAEVVVGAHELFEAGLDLYAARPDKGWSLTDCTSFLVMRERGITQALTYDRHFEQAGFEALLRRDPP